MDRAGFLNEKTFYLEFGGRLGRIGRVGKVGRVLGSYWSGEGHTVQSRVWDIWQVYC